MEDTHSENHTQHRIDALIGEARALRSTFNYDRVVELAEGALSLSREGGYARGVADSQNNLAWAYLALSSYQPALTAATEAAEIYQELGDKRAETLVRNTLGVIYRRLGHPEESRRCYDEALAISRETGERRGEAAALNGIGFLFEMQGSYYGALASHRQSLEIAREIGGRMEEANALNGIGSAYRNLGSYQEALDHYHAALDIAIEQGDGRMQAYANGNIAAVCERLGDNVSAVSYELKSLKWKEDLNDKWGMGVSLNNIGITYKNLGEYASALDAHIRSLEITEQIGDRQGVSVALNNLGELYETLGDYTRVLDYYLQSLKISQEMGYTQGEASSLHHIGRFYQERGAVSKALIHYFKSLRLFERSGDRHGERATLHGIGGVYFNLEDYASADDYYRRSLLLAQEINHPYGEAAALQSLGTVCEKLSDLDGMIEHLTRAKDLAERTDHRELYYGLLLPLSRAYLAAGDRGRSAEVRRAYQQCTEEIFNEEATLRVRELIVRFDRKNTLREGELLGLDPNDVAEINEAVRKAVRIHPPSFHPEESKGLLLNNKPSAPEAMASRQVDDSRARIRVTTFGDLSVTVDDIDLGRDDWRRKRARDLFKLLLIHHRRPLTIDEIIDKLWGGEKGGEMLVMNAISHIRRALEPERSPHAPSSVLSGKDRAYTLDLGEDAFIDFLRFKELIVSARRSTTAEERSRCYLQAVGLYRDDFLKEDYYVDWTTSERDLLKDACLEALEFLAREYLRTERNEEAIEVSRHIIHLDSTSETAYEVLMRALRERGRMGEAQKIFSECRAAFRSELNSDPPERLMMILQ